MEAEWDCVTYIRYNTYNVQPRGWLGERRGRRGSEAGEDRTNGKRQGVMREMDAEWDGGRRTNAGQMGNPRGLSCGSPLGLSETITDQYHHHHHHHHSLVQAPSAQATLKVPHSPGRPDGFEDPSQAEPDSWWRAVRIEEGSCKPSNAERPDEKSFAKAKKEGR